MMQRKQLSDTWLKASVLGCLWASSEIVLGSFLHNLRIPFASNFLTGIGIVLLVSVSYLWKNKGLFWRSGLICALMKSVSPSAIIFGPMIAIFFESLLLEFSVIIFRRNIFAFIIGGMLAMSWTFVQKITSFIIVYGFNMVNLYKDLTKFAQKQLNISFENIWSPVLALWIIYLLIGIAASLIGVYIGKKAVKKPEEIQINTTNKKDIKNKDGETAKQKTSLLWLTLNIVIMISVLCLMNFTGIAWWASFGIASVFIWALHYRKALRPLKKPKFWIIFIVITMLTSYLFTQFQAKNNDFIAGMIIGLQMNLRAAVMIIGFSVIGTELTNPVIRKFFFKTAVRQLPLALEVAFETLPFVIANIPDFKNFFKKPVSIVGQIVLQANVWLDRIMTTMNMKDRIIIISGEVGQGKTTFLKKIIELLKNNKIKAVGFISPAILDNEKRIGYYITDLLTGEEKMISGTTGNENMVKTGKYYFSNEGFDFGKKILSKESISAAQIVVIDEIGFLEINNGGWASCLTDILINSELPVIIVVRSKLVETVIQKWEMPNPLVIETGSCSPTEAASRILSLIKIPVQS